MLYRAVTYHLQRILTRPRAFWRSYSKLGLRATLRLVRMRFGSAETVYTVEVPQWPNAVFLRGGHSSDSMVLYEMLVTDEYGFVNGIESPKWIIDGGANIGLAAVYFLERYPTASVISIEPFAGTAELCRRNLAPYGSRAIVREAAIWPDEGSVCLDQRQQEWENRVRMASAGEAGTVKALTVGALIEESGGSVDLLKLDVEGSEREIFGAGAQQWLPRVRNIVIELHGEDCKERFFSAMAGYSYEVSNRDFVYFLRNIRPDRTRELPA